MATTIKLPEDLKRRVRAAAKAAAISPHAFMLRALETQTRLDEQRREFLGGAVAALAESEASGKGYRAVDVHRYILERTRGKSGYAALYSFRRAQDVALVLALRHQREAGYADLD